MTLISFVAVCGATAFVCTAIKEENDANLATATGRLFVYLAAGIAAFGGAIQLFTWMAG